MESTIPTDTEIQQILDQAPEWTTAVQVYELWSEYSGDVVAILSKLWDVPPKVEKLPTKWDIMREICDSYDDAMQEMLQKNAQARAQQQDASDEHASK